MRRKMLWVVLAWLGVTMVGWAGGVFPAAGETMTVDVPRSFYGDSFAYTMKLREKTPYYTAYDLEYPGTGGVDKFGRIYAHYYVPADWQPGNPARPGAVCLHILGGDGSLTNMICANFATNGIPAIMCYMPMFGTRAPHGGRTKMLEYPDGCQLLALALRQTPADAMRTVDVMLTRPEVNPKKINLLGTSMGGITGATVAGRDARIDKVILLLSGGDLNRIIGYSNETAKMRQAIDRSAPADRQLVEQAMKDVDPLNNIGVQPERAAAGKLRMYNAADDEVIPADAVKSLVEKSGMTGKNTMIQGVGHYTAIAALPQLLGEFTAFFRDDTVPVRKPTPPAPDQELIKSVFLQLVNLVKFTPDPGRAIFVDASYEVKNKEKVLVNGTVSLLRGDGHKFKVVAHWDKAPVGNVKQLAFGFSSYPWIASSSGTVYKGELNPEAAGPETYFNSKLGMYRQMASGVLTMAASGMIEPLQQWCKISMAKDADGKRYMSILAKNTDVKVFLKDDTAVPEKIVFVTNKASGEIVFRQWQINVPSEIAAFQPASNTKAKVVPVNQQDLDRMIAAVVNFLIQA